MLKLYLYLNVFNLSVRGSSSLKAYEYAVHDLLHAARPSIEVQNWHHVRHHRYNRVLHRLQTHDNFYTQLNAHTRADTHAPVHMCRRGHAKRNALMCLTRHGRAYGGRRRRRADPTRPVQRRRQSTFWADMWYWLVGRRLILT